MMFNPFSLDGKTVLVTGASSGLGQGIAIQCSKMGARVVLNGRNEKRLNETLSLMEGENHMMVIADLSTQEGVEKVASEVPVLDGYVNCAGIPSLIPLKNITREYMENILGVNTIAPITMLSLLLKKKKLITNASVVIIGSINGCCIGNAGSSPYSASKGALSGFIKAAALELASRGTRLNSISPGLIATKMLGMTEEMYTKEQLEAQMLPNYPMKRLGNVEDIANGAVYLLSDASSWVTGQNLVIDGGYTIA